MPTVSIEAASVSLSALVDAVASGEDVVMTRGGTPVARLVAVQTDKPRRQLGMFRGQIGRLHDDFDAPLPSDILLQFQGQ